MPLVVLIRQMASIPTVRFVASGPSMAPCLSSKPHRSWGALQQLSKIVGLVVGKRNK